MRRSLLILILISVVSLAAAAVAAPAHAGSVNGGTLNAPGEKSHNVAIGWPEISYVWEGMTREKFALGPRVGLQVWPLSLNVGLNVRLSVKEVGRVSLVMLLVPSFNVAGFGGTRATYVNNFGFGRSRTFRASVGPGFNFGLLATIDVLPVFHVNIAFENPVVVWIWTQPAEWWIEWPIVLAGGVEYDVNFSTTLYGRLGAGPSIAFSGRHQLLGIHWHAHFGVQIRY